MTVFTWEHFLDHAKEFIIISDEISDCWSLEGDINKMGMAYLKKIQTKPEQSTTCSIITDSSDECVAPSIVQSMLRWEYNVFYSCSYNVPVLCFNIWKENGSLLRLEEVWNHCQLGCQNREDLYSALTQQEHPVLLRPFFTIHPCKTVDILNITESNDHQSNNIIKYLSAMGPVINLSLNNKYGLPKS